MQYCINALLKNNNEIMQYYIIDNDIALVMHYHALLQMPDNIHSINDMHDHLPTLVNHKIVQGVLNF